MKSLENRQCLCIMVFIASLSLSLATKQQFIKDEPKREGGATIRRRLTPLSSDCTGMERPAPQLPSVPNLLDNAATYAVSFPGLGDKLITKHLVENITGMLVGEATTSPSLERMKAQHMDRTGFARGQGEVIVVRTNYPHGTPKLASYDVNRAFVVLRNPLTAIPSYFDQLYELNSHVAAGASSAETTAAFVKWRDDYLSDQLLLWEQSLSFWMEHIVDDSKRVFFSFESLVDEGSGVQETFRLAQFLEGGIRESAVRLSPNNSSVVAEAVKSFAKNTDEIFCIWSDMMATSGSGGGGLSSSNVVERPFTSENLLAISKMLLELIERWGSHQRLVSILSGYHKEVLDVFQYQVSQQS